MKCILEQPLLMISKGSMALTDIRNAHVAGHSLCFKENETLRDAQGLLHAAHSDDFFLHAP